ncbi:MAG: sigma-E processing peptidase SpoIIGA [Oscillospiraceae bacterium]
MEIIYVDSLFLLNFIIDYLLLLVTARLCSLVLRRWRYLAAAALGGAYAILCFVPGFGFLVTPWMKLCLWVLMSLAAFGGEAKLFRCALSFLLISAAFGGAVWAASMLGGTLSVIGGAVRINMRVLILSFALCYAGLSLAFSGRFGRRRREILSAAIVLRGKKIALNVLRDTGNSLREPSSGKSVLVADTQSTADLFTDEEKKALSLRDGAQSLLALADIEGAPRFRPVMYSAIGTTAGFIPAFSPDELYIDGCLTHDFVVAVSPTPLGDGEYSAVI